MKLPQGNNALILQEKLTDYILSETHSMGKFKAKLFRKLGFNETNVHLFIKALSKIAKLGEVVNLSTFQYGAKYVLDGEIDTPGGKTIKVRTIWIIERGQVRPRFVTVYPI